MYTNERFISCDGNQLYAFKGRDVDLASYREEAHTNERFIILRWKSAAFLQGAGCRSRSRGRALYRDASWAAYACRQ